VVVGGGWSIKCAITPLFIYCNFEVDVGVIKMIGKVLLYMTLKWDGNEVLKLPISLYLRKVEYESEEWDNEMQFILWTAEMIARMTGMFKAGAKIKVIGKLGDNNVDISKTLTHIPVYADDVEKEYTKERCYRDLCYYFYSENLQRVLEYELERDREYKLVSAIFGRDAVDKAIAEEKEAKAAYNK